MRHASGLSVRAWGDLIGVRDPRTVRRYEGLARVPGVVAERVARYLPPIDSRTA